MQQLDELQEILDRDEFINSTVVKELLDPYVEQHRNKTLADEAKLQKELLDIKTKETQIATYNCPCVWSEWTEWGTCSVSCGGGMHSRSRVISRNATNLGTPCDGADYEPQSCNSQFCRRFF